MFLSLVLFLGTKCVSLTLVSKTGSISLALGSGIKMFLFLGQVLDPGYPSSTGSGFRVRCSVIGWFPAPVVPFTLHPTDIFFFNVMQLSQEGTGNDLLCFYSIFCFVLLFETVFLCVVLELAL